MTEQGVGVVRPLPGEGVVAHLNGLLLVCAAADQPVEELLGALRETATTGGDGRALARRVAQVLARAMDRSIAGEPVTCAVAGPAGGGVAVLVSGAALATVSGGPGGDVHLAGRDALTWTDRLVSGPVARVALRLPGAGPSSPYARLDGGVVAGAGVECDFTQSGEPAFPPLPARPPQTQQQPMQLPPPGPPEPIAARRPIVPPPPMPPLPPAPMPPGGPPKEPAPPPQVSQPVSPPVSQPSAPQPPPSGSQRQSSQASPPSPPSGPAPSAPPAAPYAPERNFGPNSGPQPAQDRAHPQDGPYGRDRAPAEKDPPRQYDGTRQYDAPRQDDAAGKRFEPFSPGAGENPGEVTQLDAAPEMEPRPMVYGVDCKNDHFNDPRAPYCAVCGIAIAQGKVVPYKGPRPPLGVLLLDDGMTLPLDSDYLLGRDPERAPEVQSGEARPARVTSPDGSVSRRHLRVSLDNWDVNLVDLGSVNGTQIQPPGDPNFYDIPPNEPVPILPGTTVRVGVSRTMRYESRRSA